MQNSTWIAAEDEIIPIRQWQITVWNEIFVSFGLLRCRIFLAEFRDALELCQWNFERGSSTTATQLITSTTCNELTWNEGRRVWGKEIWLVWGNVTLWRMICGRIYFNGFSGFSFHFWISLFLLGNNIEGTNKERVSLKVMSSKEVKFCP